jgi:hypothetical protein
LAAQERADLVVCSADGARETIPILQKALLELTLGQHPLKIWMFAAEITDEFFLGLMICASMMHLWIWGAICYNWARKRCHYSVLGNDHKSPTVQWLATQ